MNASDPILSCWKTSTYSHLTRRIFETTKDEEFKPCWFRYLPERNFAISSESSGVKLIDPIVADWCLREYKDIDKSKFEKLTTPQRKYYLKMCLMLIHSDFSSAEEMINKLDLFGKDFTVFFTPEEIKLFMNKFIASPEEEQTSNDNHFNKRKTKVYRSQNKCPLLACELVHRGLSVPFEFCMKNGSLGSMLYSIQETRNLGLVVEQSYSKESSDFKEDKIQAYADDDFGYENFNAVQAEEFTRDGMSRNSVNKKETSVEPSINNNKNVSLWFPNTKEKNDVSVLFDKMHNKDFSKDTPHTELPVFVFNSKKYIPYESDVEYTLIDPIGTNFDVSQISEGLNHMKKMLKQDQYKPSSKSTNIDQVIIEDEKKEDTESEDSSTEDVKSEVDNLIQDFDFSTIEKYAQKVKSKTTKHKDPFISNFEKSIPYLENELKDIIKNESDKCSTTLINIEGVDNNIRVKIESLKNYVILPSEVGPLDNLRQIANRSVNSVSLIDKIKSWISMNVTIEGESKEYSTSNLDRSYQSDNLTHMYTKIATSLYDLAKHIPITKKNIFYQENLGYATILFNDLIRHFRVCINDIDRYVNVVTLCDDVYKELCNWNEQDKLLFIKSIINNETSVNEVEIQKFLNEIKSQKKGTGLTYTLNKLKDILPEDESENILFLDSLISIVNSYPIISTDKQEPDIRLLVESEETSFETKYCLKSNLPISKPYITRSDIEQKEEEDCNWTEFILEKKIPIGQWFDLDKGQPKKPEFDFKYSTEISVKVPRNSL
jgi:hypothetical protein